MLRPKNWKTAWPILIHTNILYAYDQQLVETSMSHCRRRCLFDMILSRVSIIPECRARCYWWPSLSIGLGVLCFYSKTGFWPSYCQISTDLGKILYRPIVVWNTLVGRLRPRSAVGGSRPNQNDYVFVIFVTPPKSYTETTSDRRDFGGKPSKWKWGRVLSCKIPLFCSVGGARSKTAFFAFLVYPL